MPLFVNFFSVIISWSTFQCLCPTDCHWSITCKTRLTVVQHCRAVSLIPCGFFFSVEIFHQVFLCNSKAPKSKVFHQCCSIEFWSILLAQVAVQCCPDQKRYGSLPIVIERQVDEKLLSNGVSCQKSELCQ